LTFFQFGNETNDPTTTDHQTKALTTSEMEAIEARMMLRHLTERCVFYGLDQPGELSWDGRMCGGVGGGFDWLDAGLG
jgi:hypothetical protein